MASHEQFWIYIPYKFQILTSSSEFLARLTPFLRVEYESDFRVGDKGISNGRVEATSENREKFWRFWRAYCKPLGIEPYLEEVDFQTKTWLQQYLQAVCKKAATAMENRYKM